MGISQRVPVAGGGHEKELFPLQIGTGERGSPGVGVPLVQGGHEPDLFHQMVVHPGFLADVGAVPGEDHIVFSFQESCGQQVGGIPVAGDVDVGEGLMEISEFFGKITVLIALGVADAEGAYRSCGRLPGPLHRLAHPFQDGPGFHKKDLACRGQGNGAGVSVHQLHPQALFQGMDLLGDGSL